MSDTAPAALTVETVFGSSAKKIAPSCPKPILEALKGYIKEAKLDDAKKNEMKAHFVEVLNNPAVRAMGDSGYRLAQINTVAFLGKELAAGNAVPMKILPLSVASKPFNFQKTGSPAIRMWGFARSEESESPYDDVSTIFLTGFATKEAAEVFATQIQEGKIYPTMGTLPREGSDLVFVNASALNPGKAQDNGVAGWEHPFAAIEKKYRAETVATLLGMAKPDQNAVHVLSAVSILGGLATAKDNRPYGWIRVVDDSLPYALIEKFDGGLQCWLPRALMDLAVKQGSIVSLVVSGREQTRKVKDKDNIEREVKSPTWNILAARIDMDFSANQGVPDPKKPAVSIPGPGSPPAANPDEPVVDEI